MNMLFELIRVALGTQDRISRLLSVEEWQRVYQTAVKQSVVGICVEGISKLPKEQKPPMELYMQWLGTVSQIQQQNEKIDKQTATIWKQLKDDGLDAAILKGQGIATEYGELSSLRQSGDIDIWVRGGIRRYVITFRRPFQQTIWHITDSIILILRIPRWNCTTGQH